MSLHPKAHPRLPSMKARGIIAALVVLRGGEIVKWRISTTPEDRHQLLFYQCDSPVIRVEHRGKET